MDGFKFDVDRSTLTRSELIVLEYCHHHLEDIPFESISQLADKLKLSTATLSRFAKRMGYKNFRVLKKAIFKSSRVSPKDKLSNVVGSDKEVNIREWVNQEKELMDRTLTYTSEEMINKAIDVLLKANRVFIYGKGAARCLSYLLDFRLKRFSCTTCLINHDGSEIFEDLVHLKSEDGMFVIGFGKIPMESRIILDYVIREGIDTILLTDQVYNEFQAECIHHLYTCRGESNDFHTMTAPNMVIDLLTLLVGKRLEKENRLETLENLYVLKEMYKEKIHR